MLNLIKNKKIKNEGFALVEVLIAISIFIAISFLVYLFQGNVFKFNNILQSSLNAQQNARKILSPFAEEIRSATISNVGAYPIGEASPNSIIFYSDIDSDGLKERIRYFKDGTDFKKGIIEPSGNPYEYSEEDEDIVSVVSNVQNGDDPIFEYFDSSHDGYENTDPLVYPIQLTEITLVKAKILIDENINEEPGPIEVSTKAVFRNLKN